MTAGLSRLAGLLTFAAPRRARRPGLSEPRPIPDWHRYYGSVAEPAVARSRQEEFERLRSPITLRWIDGLALRLVPGEQLSRALYVSSTYEPNTLCVLRAVLRPGDTFLDVGAHAGVVSLAASKWVGPAGRVYSFEPSVREFRRLVENLELSRSSNVTPFRIAVGAASGAGALRVAEAVNSGLNTMGDRFSYDGVATARLEAIETVDLDHFLEREAIGAVAAIKLDVEGAEAAALAGARHLLEERRPAVVFEVNAGALSANGSDRGEIVALLQSADYGLFAIDERTARLVPVATLAAIDNQNVVGLPLERKGLIEPFRATGAPPGGDA